MHLFSPAVFFSKKSGMQGGVVHIQGFPGSEGWVGAIGSTPELQCEDTAAWGAAPTPLEQG